MRSFFRIGLLATGLVLGAQASAHAQEADSLLYVRHGGKTLLRLRSDGGFVVDGEDGVGKIPSESAGPQLKWYPAKGAIRVGWLGPSYGHIWSDFYTGYGSVAMGYVPMATLPRSVAIGVFAWAQGVGAVAIGGNSFPEADSAFTTSHSVARARGALAIGFFVNSHSVYGVGIGYGAKIYGKEVVSIGAQASADGTSTITLGGGLASGSHSVTIGRRAASNGKTGAIVVADRCNSSRPNDSVHATANHQFLARACGGHLFYTDEGLTTGVQVASGSGSWSSVSDVNRKENFAELDGEEVLRELRGLPVRTWNYSTQDASIRHAGPTAQDFHAAFGLGESDLLISGVDADGVALAAIKALEVRTVRLRERGLEPTTIGLTESRRRLDSLEERLERLEAGVGERDETPSDVSPRRGVESERGPRTVRGVN